MKFHHVYTFILYNNDYLELKYIDNFIKDITLK
jgi:hypothetical protein